MSEKKLFTKYVSQNILGMLGISVYILADTFFYFTGGGSGRHHSAQSCPASV